VTTDKKSVDLDDLLTLDQLSQLLQVRKSWVYRQVREQAIPHVHLGKYLRFSRTEVERWLAQHQGN
jgi:excisionase family DNA binding protein